MNKVVKEDFLEEVTCEQRPERSEGASFRKSLGRDGGGLSKLPLQRPRSMRGMGERSVWPV